MEQVTITISAEQHGALTKEDLRLLKELIRLKDYSGIEEIIGDWKRNYLITVK